MKTKTTLLLFVAAAFVAGLFAAAPLGVTALAPLSSHDRATLIADLRDLAVDDSGWAWIEYYEVGLPKTNPDAYLSRFNFERLKATRSQALLDAAWILETYQPATSPAAQQSARD